jgi:serine/threonine-protein kinase HipA
VLYDGAGWRLTPAYDLNPVPAHVRLRELSTPIDVDGDPTASLELAVAAAPEFLLKAPQARAIAADVARVTATWSEVAIEVGLGAGEIDRMASAFEHAELERALRWR